MSLAWVIQRGRGHVALPLLPRLVPAAGHTSKLVAAMALVRAVCQLLVEQKVRVLADSWYMRQSFIESMRRRGFHVIGQVRIDTRLYDAPSPRRPGQRGRPRKYGEKYTAKRIAHLKRTETTLRVHGREQEVRYRSKVLLARFSERLLGECGANTGTARESGKSPACC